VEVEDLQIKGDDYHKIFLKWLGAVIGCHSLQRGQYLSGSRKDQTKSLNYFCIIKTVEIIHWIDQNHSKLKQNIQHF